MTDYVVPPMLSWQEFIDAAKAPETIRGGARTWDDEWASVSWDEALRLAVDGWPLALREADVTVAALRERAGLGVSAITLEPTWDVTGSEVDIGVYLAGVPECMVDAVPRRTSRRGRVVTFLVPAAYSNYASHEEVENRGLALATLSTAIIEAGHSVEVWSGWAGWTGENLEDRYSGVAKVITAGEPFDVGRLIFAVAHPAMCRRLWHSVWDAQPAAVARQMEESNYSRPPFECRPEDLPDGIADPYVFPFLQPDDPQWTSLDNAMSWCHEMFADLGLIEQAVLH